MRKILISINPEYVDKILSGIKKFEYRTRVAKEDIDGIIIYCTFPRMKVLAEVEILGVLSLPPEQLWEQTKDKSGIEKEFFDAYFLNRKTAYAYKLGEVRKYETEKTLKEFGCKAAPQSFIYILG